MDAFARMYGFVVLVRGEFGGEVDDSVWGCQDKKSEMEAANVG